MRAVLTTALTLFLLTSATWAADTTKTGEARKAEAGNQAILLLVPADKVSDFRQALSPPVSQDIAMVSGAPAISIEGKQYTLVGLPAHRLDDLHKAIGEKPFHDDVKLMLSFGQFINVTDLSTLESRLGMQTAAGQSSQSMAPSREQTSASSSQFQGGTTGQGWRGLPKDHVVLLVPKDALRNLSVSQSAGREILVLMPIDEYNRMAGTAASGSTAAGTSMSPTRDQSSATSPGMMGTTSTEARVSGDVRQLRRDIARVERIEAAAGGRDLKLADGRTLFLPDSVRPQGAALEPGARLSGSYMERDGRSIVTSLKVEGRQASD